MEFSSLLKRDYSVRMRLLIRGNQPQRVKCVTDCLISTPEATHIMRCSLSYDHLTMKRRSGLLTK